MRVLFREVTMQSAVLVTGASTGIGAAIAESLAKNGYAVFAGVRDDAAAASIETVAGDVRAIRLDVTDAAAIAAAVETLAASGLPLAGLVNNAGISVAGPTERLPIDAWRKQFEVNLFGQIAMTQAFIPALRASKGRAIFIGSIAGRLAVPFLGPYSASKFALRAAVDSLRVELAPSGIAVALIQPGAVKTPIWQKGRAGRDAMVAEMGANATAGYDDAVEALVRATHDSEAKGIPPEDVAKVVLEALTVKKPRAHYLVGADARIQALLSRLPANVSDALLRKAMKLP
jgi:NAD(P)-dependent dehydrogenase (short-subunit alcohol dehydrogenase family)